MSRNSVLARFHGKLVLILDFGSKDDCPQCIDHKLRKSILDYHWTHCTNPACSFAALTSHLEQIDAQRRQSRTTT